MKKSIRYIALALALILPSCNLDEEPIGFFSSENFYKTKADAESALLYAYNALTFLEYSRGIFYIGDIPTETMSPKSDEAGDVYMLENWIAGSETEQLIYYFKYCYISINRANTVIENVGNSSLSAAEKKTILGEAYFLRAWSYFNLTRTFGLVPIHTQAITSLQQTTATIAKNLNELYALIISDLKTSEAMLEVNKVYGRADKVAAQALLSKVYLTIASAKEHNVLLYRDMNKDVQKMYDSAAYYSNVVITDYNNVYYYDDNIRNIFDVEKPDGPEHIFILGTDRSGTQEGNYSKLPLMFLPSNNAVPFYIKFGNGDLVKANGNGWGVFLCNDQFVETQFAATDLRRTELIHRAIYDANGDVITPNQIKGYFSSKYVDPDFIGERTSGRPYLLRFSDIALVYAEAVGPVQGLPVLNRIRERANATLLPEGMSVEDFRTAVLRERALELAFEGNRLFDLRRTAAVTTTDENAFALNEEDAAFYPIPQRELDLNPNVN